VFTNTPLSLERDYKPGRFNFNVKGGRCEGHLSALEHAFSLPGRGRITTVLSPTVENSTLGVLPLKQP
jgi:hypothetical protein